MTKSFSPNDDHQAADHERSLGERSTLLKTTPLLLIATGILLTYVSCYLCRLPEEVRNGFADQLGRLVLYSLYFVVIWVILRTLTPKEKRFSGLWAYALLFFAYTGYSAIERTILGYSARKAIRRIVRLSDDLADSIHDPNVTEFGSYDDRSPGIGNGEFESIVAILENYARDLDRESQDFEQRTAAFDIDRILTADVLGSTRAIDTQIEVVKNFRIQQQEYFETLEVLYERLRYRLMAVSGSDYQEYSFNKSIRSKEVFFAGAKANTDELTTAILSYLQFVRAKHEEVFFEDNKIVFKTESDLERYRLMQIGIEQARLRLALQHQDLVSDFEAFRATIKSDFGIEQPAARTDTFLSSQPFVDSEHGFSLHFPRNWRTSVPVDGPQFVFAFPQEDRPSEELVKMYVAGGAIDQPLSATEYAAVLGRESARSVDSFVLEERIWLPIARAPAEAFVASFEFSGRPFRAVQYAVVASDRGIVISGIAPAQEFDNFRPLFDESAQSLKLIPPATP